MTDERLALARDASDTRLPGEVREAAMVALCAAVRSGLGYLLPDGTTATRWREASRAWLALARGTEPGKAGRPAGKAGGRRVTLYLSAEAHDAIRAHGGSAWVERIVLDAATPRTWPLRSSRMSDNGDYQTVWVTLEDGSEAV